MKILSLFTKTVEEKEAKQAIRIAKALKRGQEALLDNLEARKDRAQETLDRLVEGNISDIDTETFNMIYHKAKLELLLVEKEIKIAKQVSKELYTDEKK